MRVALIGAVSVVVAGVITAAATIYVGNMQREQKSAVQSAGGITHEGIHIGKINMSAEGERVIQIPVVDGKTTINME